MNKSKRFVVMAIALLSGLSLAGVYKQWIEPLDVGAYRMFECALGSSPEAGPVTQGGMSDPQRVYVYCRPIEPAPTPTIVSPLPTLPTSTLEPMPTPTATQAVSPLPTPTSTQPASPLPTEQAGMNWHTVRLWYDDIIEFVARSVLMVLLAAGYI